MMRQIFNAYQKTWTKKIINGRNHLNLIEKLSGRSLAWSRTSACHAGDPGSNPGGRTTNSETVFSASFSFSESFRRRKYSLRAFSRIFEKFKPLPRASKTKSGDKFTRTGFLRRPNGKAEAARAKYPREPKKILAILTVKRDVAKEMRRIAGEEGVGLIIGRITD
jgi:hypothetical protein